jgi:predicted acyl esterase
VACFTSAPLQHPLDALVRPKLRLRLSADQPGFDLCASLSRLEPDGSVHQLSVGVQRHCGDACLESRWRQVSLQPLWLELRPGERLRLSLAMAAWPQIAVNPGTGELPGGCRPSDQRVITLRLELEGARLELEPMLSDGNTELLGQTDAT